jgi:photosynthetic reaction center H subunit
MMAGANAGGVDIAFISLIAFVAFFFALVLWLHRESKREGYPLAPDLQDRYSRYAIVGFPAPPPAKTFHLATGEDVVVDGGRPDTRALALKPREPWPGAPLEPTGNPLVDGVGPASWAERADTPDKLYSGANRLEPLRVATDFHVAEDDPNPVGMKVISGDRKVVGTVRDIWIDRAEYVMRYMEADIDLPGGATRRALIPTNFTRVHGKDREVFVKALYAEHFADIPALRNADQVTLLEEDKVMGYFGGGTLYAGNRAEPLL